jgi:squalene-hopene/tetraprenyl-beta-curcumene cyclase
VEAYNHGLKNLVSKSQAGGPSELETVSGVRIPGVVAILLLCLVALPGLAAQDGSPTRGAAPVVSLSADNTSLRNEIQHSIDLGLEWLKANQNTNGWWHSADYPAVTALAVTAFHGDPMDRYRNQPSGTLKRAYAYLLSHVREDGGIYVAALPTYNTAISLMAFVTSNQPEYDAVILRARGFLAGVQRDFGEPGRMDSPFDGGFGYGLPTDTVSDMSNTLMALEAMYYSKRWNADQPTVPSRELNWAAAIHFLQSCQNLPSHNPQGWVSGDSKDLGGFVYHAGRSNAGGTTNATTGRLALRSYGSISYAGFLSYLYAELDREDPRVRAVFDWLKANYTLQENPGMGAQGLYFYYHTMTRALSTAGIDELELADGTRVNWRQQLALKLIQLQNRDGSWSNQNARWWEKEPELATAYMLLSLETLWNGLGD